MSSTVPLRCRCGAVRGVATDVAPHRGNHIVCYCDDCQAFARFLGRDDVMDAYGGTAIFQVTPSQLRIEVGADQLRCMRLSESGMHRWYAGCCNTPIANTMGSARAPFAGVITTFMADPSPDALGPAKHVQGKFAKGAPPPRAWRSEMLRAILGSLRVIVRGALVGAHSPSPFFDPDTKAPRATPKVLTREERDALR